MTGYDLPTKAEINGKEWDIRSDYRAALDIIGVMNDAELSDEERGIIVMAIAVKLMFGNLVLIFK